MKLWLAVDKENNSLGVVEADSVEQAFYQFMPDGIYPDRVILLPDTVTLRVPVYGGDTEGFENPKDQAYYDGYGDGYETGYIEGKKWTSDPDVKL